MRDQQKKELYHNIVKSKFVRSIFIRIVLIFLIVIAAIIGIAFFSFNSEINHNIINERQMQLDAVETTISQRMGEVSSISYDIGSDSAFYLGSVEDVENAGYKMSEILGRYLIGNDFIEHLAYYKIADSEVIYTAKGELQFRDFWKAYVCKTDEEVDELITGIMSCDEVAVRPVYDNKGNFLYLSYLCPYPRLSQNPQAYVLMLISFEEVEPLMESQLASCSGEIMVFDSLGTKLYTKSSMEEKVDISFEDIKDTDEIKIGNTKFAVLHKVSESNGWHYVSLIRKYDMVSDAASKQIVFIVLLLILMVTAIVVLLMGIIMQYKPINQLALEVTEKEPQSGKSGIIDEESLLTDTIATLKDDSEQKKKFEEAYHEANAANKAKSTFLSNMSHDIRTPMNAIVGMTEIAMKHAEEPILVTECLQNVQTASQYLLDIINNILDMSRIESGQFVLSEDTIDFPKMISGIVTILNHSIEVKSQHLIVEVENVKNEKVIGDSIRLTQVFMNVLSNAVKFTPNGGTVTFSIKQEECQAEGYGAYLFTFTDTGIGMSQEFISRVFDTFTRDNDAGVGKIEGTGLGMAIAKSFVDLMGGTIHCESEQGKGTKFQIRLEMKIQSDDVIVDISEEERTKSVLIIGDESRIVMNQAEIFTELGVSVDYVFRVDEVLSDSRNNKYTHIILNQSDADKSGIQALLQLKGKYPIEETKYILAAKNMFSIEKSYAVDSGIREFVQIPIFRSTAISMLKRTFDIANQQEDEKVCFAGKRVLLVEDNMINRKIARTMIGETKAEVVEVINGKEAVEAFKNHDVGYFDLIFMDVQMPIMNGYEATFAIRSIQREDAKRIPIYAMTANTFDEDVRQVKESGMNGHLGKPYVSKELYHIMEIAFRS